MTTHVVHFVIPKERYEEIVPALIRAIGPEWKPRYFRAYFFGNKPRKSGLSGTSFHWRYEKFGSGARNRVLNAFQRRGLVGDGEWVGRMRKSGRRLLPCETIWLRFDAQPYDIGFIWTVEHSDGAVFAPLIKLCEDLGCLRKEDEEWKD